MSETSEREIKMDVDKLQEMLSPEQRVDTSTGRKSFDGHNYLKNIPLIECADGLRMSVQASAMHYCSPRDSEGPWHSVEVGFPSERIEEFMLYIDGGPDDDPTETVYGYVPIEIVAKVIADHGGLNGDQP